MRPSGWTPDRVETLKTLWLQGLSGSMIAEHFGDVTREAVVAKVHRLGADCQRPPEMKPARRPRARAPKPVAQPMPKSTHPWRRTIAGGRADPAQPRLIVGAVSEYRTATFFEGTLALRENCCRWPFGSPRRGRDIAYCGRPKECGSSYCRHHLQRAMPTAVLPQPSAFLLEALHG